MCIVINWNNYYFEFLCQHQSHAAVEGGATNVNQVDEAAVDSFLREWGVDQSVRAGGLVKKGEGNNNSSPEGGVVPRKVYLLQRKEGKLGASLGKTTVSNKCRYVCMYIYAPLVFMYVCMYVWTICVCMYVCTICVCMYVCMYVCNICVCMCV